jgi:hypothetical protein
MSAFCERLGMKSQNIALVGAGANGAGIGAGLDVTFIEPAHAEAMRRTVVWVVMPVETLVTPVYGLPRAGAAPPRSLRARERGADRNRRQDRERGVWPPCLRTPTF